METVDDLIRERLFAIMIHQSHLLRLYFLFLDADATCKHPSLKLSQCQSRQLSRSIAYTSGTHTVCHKNRRLMARQSLLKFTYFLWWLVSRRCMTQWYGRIFSPLSYPYSCSTSEIRMMPEASIDDRWHHSRSNTGRFFCFSTAHLTLEL